MKNPSAAKPQRGFSSLPDLDGQLGQGVRVFVGEDFFLSYTIIVILADLLVPSAVFTVIFDDPPVPLSI